MKKIIDDKKQKLGMMFKQYANHIHINGLENIPKMGNTIFLVNHNCFLDIYLIAYVLNKPCISMVSANSLFGSNNERKDKLNELLYPFPVETRAKAHYTDVCLDGAIKLLKSGKDLIIFPQGVFDEKGKISKARTGAIRILFEALDEKKENYRLIPIALSISNINENNIQSSNIWNDFEATISILPKFDYTSYYEDYKKFSSPEERRIILHHLVDDIMKEMANKLKCEYIDKYKPLYYMDGFWFPDGKYIKFEDSQDEKLYNKYKEMINSIVERYINNI